MCQVSTVSHVLQLTVAVSNASVYEHRKRWAYSIYIAHGRIITVESWEQNLRDHAIHWRLNNPIAAYVNRNVVPV